jgi:hypothetical protein
VFQPLALAQLLRAAAGEEQDWQQHVVEARGRWQSYDFHSTIGAESPVELLQTIQDTVRRVGEFVRTADTVVLTLGTAWAYRLRETGELVSNLHKLPAGLFEKELLTADEIVNALAEVHALLRRVNPNVHIALTVSPVRHIKDTLPLNAVSKSVLRVACHYLSELLPNVSYFPAYELLTDDLRDYRFYAADMLHPSEVAEDYIWERFARAYFDGDFGRFRKEWAAVRQSLGHRPLHIGAPEHRAFLDQTRERLERMTSQGVDVRQELRDVQRQLVSLPPPRPVRVPEVEVEDDEERIDIGEASTTTAPSPDERAAQNAPQQQERRRDGRRNDRSGRSDRRDNRSASPVVVPAEEASAPVEAMTIEAAESVAASAEALLINPDAELLLATPEGAGYPAKKKKRRSRGGAKRTARKNAARLAEQDTSLDASLDDAELAVSEDNNLVDTIPEISEFAVETPVEELVTPTPAFDSEPVAASEDTSAGEVGAASEAEAVVAQPTRKRGTGPTPKKSKVITKSGLVKRGQRGGLYRTTTPESSATSAPASAPIISPPIIPEIFVERPAADFAMPPEPPVELDLAATVLGLFSSKPKAPVAASQPKRGRPKAAAVAPTVDAIDETAAAAEPTNASADGAPSEAAIAAEVPKTPVKKASPRSAKAAKPAATKKVAAAKPTAAKKPAAKAAKPATKPAAPRKGRPPGKATPPAADAPTS